MWWAESLEEVGFVMSHFKEDTTFHLGYRSVSHTKGFVHSDFSIGVGLFGFTTDDAETTNIPEGEDYLTNDKCLGLTLTSTSFEQLSDCSQGRGVCKRKLAKGSGFKSLASFTNLSPDFSSSITEPGYPSGNGPYQFEFIENWYSSNLFLDIELHDPEIISGFFMETTKTKWVKEFYIKYRIYSTSDPNQEWYYIPIEADDDEQIVSPL